MRHLMSPLDLSVEELEHLLDLANDIEQNPEKYAHACDGKKIATLFYEPKVKAFLIPFALFPVLQTSVPCVIQKRVPRWSLLWLLKFP